MAVDTAGLQVALTELATEVFVEAAGIMHDELLAVAPEDTGALKEGLVVSIGGTGVVSTGTIVSEATYSSETDTGSRPHQIDGNPLLAFQWGGQTVIVHSVQHPGSPGTRWWTDTMTEAQWLAACSAAIDAVPFV